MRRFADAAARNTGPILEVLRGVLPERARVLELGSGTGQHAIAIASALPGIDWQPSDPSPEARASIGAWIEDEGVANVRPPIDLDATRRPWPIEGALDAVIAINVVHISPWEVACAIVQEAAARLRPGGVLVLYGPYFVDGEATESNRAFDRSLRARDPSWGVRELRDVQAIAAASGFAARPPVAMPANNLTLVFDRVGLAREDA
jgi:SAM-dependent methyltransferase